MDNGKYILFMVGWVLVIGFGVYAKATMEVTEVDAVLISMITLVAGMIGLKK